MDLGTTVANIFVAHTLALAVNAPMGVEMPEEFARRLILGVREWSGYEGSHLINNQ